MISGRYLPTLEDLLFAAGQEIFVGTTPVVVGVIPVAFDADTLVLADAVTFDTGQYLVRMGAYLDGNGPGGHDQVLRGVVYSNGVLVATGEGVTVPAGQAGLWVTLPFAAPGVALGVGGCQFGIQAGAAGDGARYFREGTPGGTTTYTGLPYSAGAPASLPSGSRVTEPSLFFLETISGVAVPAAVTDEYLAGLPFDVAQRVFRSSGVQRASAVPAIAGWYGTSFDPHAGSSAVVRSDGPLASMAGQRILVTRREPVTDRQVAVYVHAQRVFPVELASEDVLLSGRAFLALGDQALDSLDVTIGVLG